MSKRPDQGGCGCSQNPNEPERRPPANRPLLRSVDTPHSNKLVEVVVHKDGTQPARVLLPANEVSPDLIRKLGESLPDLPRMETGKGKGGVDIRLENPSGTHVKRGLVLLEGPDGAVPLEIDANTRRFRKGGLTPGKYNVRASSAQYGRGNTSITVRKVT